jgi:hypothetical protein
VKSLNDDNSLWSSQTEGPEGVKASHVIGPDCCWFVGCCWFWYGLSREDTSGLGTATAT